MSATDRFDLSTLEPGTPTHALVEHLVDVDVDAERALVRAPEHQAYLRRCLNEWARQLRRDRANVDRLGDRVPAQHVVAAYGFRIPAPSVTRVDGARSPRLVAELVAQEWLAVASKSPARYHVDSGVPFGVKGSTSTGGRR